MFSLRNALIVVLVLIATGLGVWIASAALTSVTVVYTIDDKDPAGFTNPVDDDCPVGAPCKVKSDLNVARRGPARRFRHQHQSDCFRGRLSVPQSPTAPSSAIHTWS